MNSRLSFFILLLLFIDVIDDKRPSKKRLSFFILSLFIVYLAVVYRCHRHCYSLRNSYQSFDGKRSISLFLSCILLSGWGSKKLDSPSEQIVDEYSSLWRSCLTWFLICLCMKTSSGSVDQQQVNFAWWFVLWSWSVMRSSESSGLVNLRLKKVPVLPIWDSNVEK